MIKKLAKSIITKFRQLSRKKKIIVIVLILILGGIGYLLWRNATKPPEYTLEAAKLDSIVEVVSETGNVTTAGAIPIYSTTTGMVEEVFIKNGDYVYTIITITKVLKNLLFVNLHTLKEAYNILLKYLLKCN